MRKLVLALAGAAVLAIAGGPAGAQETSAPREPSTLISVLADMQARAELHSQEGEAVRLNVVTPGGIFGAQFLGCNAEGKACRALQFTASIGKRPLTAEDLNGFNEREVLCRAVLVGEQVDVRYGLLLSDNLTEADLKAHVGVWQGCLGSIAGLVSGES